MEQTITDQPTASSVGIKWGVIAGLLIIIVGIIKFVTSENPFESRFDWTSVVGLLISVGAIVLAHKEFKEKGDGYMTYGKGLVIGLIIGLVSAVLNLVFMYVYFTFVDTTAMQQILDNAAAQMEAQNQPEEAIEMGMKMVVPMFWIMIVVASVFMAFVYSLIVSIFTQKNNPQPDF